MKLSMRELALAWITGVIILIALTYTLLEPVIEEWRSIRSDMAEVGEDIRDEQNTISLGPQWEARLDGILQSVPRHAPGVDVTASLLKEIEAQTESHGFGVVQRNAGEEEVHPEFSSLDIQYRGNASLDSIVSFLYELKSPSAMLEVKQLKIDKDKHDYSVRVTINCLYGRQET